MANVQRTVVLLKPDALQRDLLGEIIARFERKGYKIVAMKLIQLSNALVDEHYAHHKAKSFFAGLKKFMMHTPVVAMILEGDEAVASVRKILGATNPLNAEAGTIRGDFALATASNLVHASDTAENAAIEVKRFFKEEEIFSYEKISDRYHSGD